MDQATLRGWWAARQGLDGSLAGASPAQVLERCGWARSVAGAAPYLTMFSRARLSRQAVDQAAAELEIHELPAARNCTYVVPASDFALALKAGQRFNNDRKELLKLGVTDKEFDRLCAAVLKVLVGGPLEPGEIREAAGGAVRSLGPAGVKRGMSSTLPAALSVLEAVGEIRRISVNGRFDQQRYRYALWKPNPLTACKLTDEEAYTELARRYFRWIAPATLAEFQWFSGLGVKAAKAAIEPLGLVPLDEESARLLFPDDHDQLMSFRTPKDPVYTLTASIDSLVLLRRDHRSLLDPKDAARKAIGERLAQPLGLIADLPSHAIFDRGRLIGLWEYDPMSASIAWMNFGVKDPKLRQAVKETEAFIRDQMGDARSFSLDSPKSRTPRIEALRAAG